MRVVELRSFHSPNSARRAAPSARAEELRVHVNHLQYLCVLQGKLLRWVDLYRFAVEPTIKQINDSPVASGFLPGKAARYSVPYYFVIRPKLS